MTDDLTNHAEAAQYVQTWSDVLSQVLAEIAGAPLPSAVLPEAPPELAVPSETDLWIAAASSGSLRGEMTFRLPVASAVHMARIFMSEPPDPAAELTADYRDAVIELFRQISGLVATAIKASRGEVQIHIDFSAAPSWPAASTAWLRIGENPPAWLEVQLSAALTAGLRTETQGAAAEPAAMPADPAPHPDASVPEPAAAEPSGSEEVNLGLLMDVELNVMLRFGSRSLLLRDVLDLHPGTVVDLDRQVQEPVDMLLDGRIVARGEIVVMDGTYGLRITEVAPAGA